MCNIAEGFEETINYGTIGYVDPLSIYPHGYRNDLKVPLPYINVALQKNDVSIYNMGFAENKRLQEWFRGEYAQKCT